MKSPWTKLVQNDTAMRAREVAAVSGGWRFGGLGVVVLAVSFWGCGGGGGGVPSGVNVRPPDPGASSTQSASGGSNHGSSTGGATGNQSGGSTGGANPGNGGGQGNANGSGNGSGSTTGGAMVTVSDYRLAVTLQLSGALTGTGIHALAYALDSGQLLVAGTSGSLAAFTLPAPHDVVTKIRYRPPQLHLSLPVGMTFFGRSDELVVLDWNSSGPGKKRLVRIDRGADGLFCTIDDAIVDRLPLPASLDDASGLAYRTRNGELFFTVGGIQGAAPEVVVTDTSGMVERRRLALPGGFGRPSDACFVGDRLVVCSLGGDLVVLDPDSGTVVPAVNDPIGRLASQLAGYQISAPDGLAAGFFVTANVPRFAESPLFVAHGVSRQERVAVFVPR